jgi:hypothetical protein
MKAYSVTTDGWKLRQEVYETGTDSKKRSVEIRKAGFQCYSQSLGSQITSVGLVRLTLLNVLPNYENGDGSGYDGLPPVQVERL